MRAGYHTCFHTLYDENTYMYIRILKHIRGSLNTFRDFFRMGIFIDSTHMKTLVPFEVISTGCNALVVPFQQLLEGPMEVVFCEPVNDLRHSLFYLLNCLINILYFYIIFLIYLFCLYFYIFHLFIIIFYNLSIFYNYLFCYLLFFYCLFFICFLVFFNFLCYLFMYYFCFIYFLFIFVN